MAEELAMWFFNSPEIAFGEEALSYLERLEGTRAFIVTDEVIVRLGHAARVEQLLRGAGFQVATYDKVEPNPSLETVRAGAAAMTEFQPDWIVGVGGGSVIDAAKGMWILYERPDMDPEGINPIEVLHLRRKARLVAIPTTSGTGSDATWAVVLTNVAERRKLGLGSREALPDIAIVDPSFVMAMPPRLTADTGMDALTHAVEGYTCSFRNDFSDGLCLKAAELVFQFLPRAYADGRDAEARTKMHCAASIAGLGFGNSMASLAHGLGHSLGAVFHVAHGLAVGLFLPYVIEFCVRGEPGTTRYGELARHLGLPGTTEPDAASGLAEAIRALQRKLDEPTTLAGCGIAESDLEAQMRLLVSNCGNDSSTVTSTRIPDDLETQRLYEYAYEGKAVDF
jgi:alcohol dehydrogenase class IV